ncbi:MAG: hypothetical protein HYU99_08330 [Deltaproteobacteria bacterium]|nr:hypothetical protein [Deltaproteobacteria bacterium]
MIRTIGFVASLALPLFNIPLMVKIIRRRSSEDLSLVWLLGVFSCLILIEPAALASSDFIFRFFATLNVILFSGVVATALYFRLKGGGKSERGSDLIRPSEPGGTGAPKALPPI